MRVPKYDDFDPTDEMVEVRLAGLLHDLHSMQTEQIRARLFEALDIFVPGLYDDLGEVRPCPKCGKKGHWGCRPAESNQTKVFATAVRERNQDGSGEQVRITRIWEEPSNACP